MPRRLPVRFGSEARMCGGSALDVSEGGLRVEAPEAFPTNSIVTVFVQFPRHSVRLKARVAWVGGGDGSATTIGLSFTHPEPTLVNAYKEWLAEIKLIAQETGAGESRPAEAPAGATPGAPTPAAAPAPAAAPRRAEPKAPVRRRLETHQGNAYDVLLDPCGGGWRLTIAQLPRQLGVDAPDLEQDFRDYAAAEKALREFIQSH